MLCFDGTFFFPENTLTCLVEVSFHHTGQVYVDRASCHLGGLCSVGSVL